jgi:hypothetical protein
MFFPLLKINADMPLNAYEHLASMAAVYLTFGHSIHNMEHHAPSVSW